jgi:enoyl-CoA hydratase/carnithine racemase
MDRDCLFIENKGNVAIVTINRPEKKNAFDELMFQKLADAASSLNAHLPRAVIITGSGDTSFSAGFDVNPDNPMVKKIIDAAAEKNTEPAKELMDTIHKAVNSFVNLPVPVIAAMNGSAYGGGAELAMRCDMRVIDPEAVICFSETKLGLMPDWGGCSALSFLAGTARAAEMVLTARKVSADEAYTMGIVNKITRKGGALEEAIDMANIIASNGPRAVRSSLALIRESRNLSYNESLEMEKELASSLVSSGECFHGVGAFLNKKSPIFPEID